MDWSRKALEDPRYFPADGGFRVRRPNPLPLTTLERLQARVDAGDEELTYEGWQILVSPDKRAFVIDGNPTTLLEAVEYADQANHPTH